MIREFITIATVPDDYDVKNSGREELIRCKDCRHRFDGEIKANCCAVLMKKAKWLVEITVDDDWHCGSGERKEE